MSAGVSQTHWDVFIRTLLLQQQVMSQILFHMTYMVNHCLRPRLEEAAAARYTMETKNRHRWTVSDSQEKDGGRGCLMRAGPAEWGNLRVFTPPPSHCGFHLHTVSQWKSVSEPLTLTEDSPHRGLSRNQTRRRGDYLWWSDVDR